MTFALFGMRSVDVHHAQRAVAAALHVELIQRERESGKSYYANDLTGWTPDLTVNVIDNTADEDGFHEMPDCRDWTVLIEVDAESDWPRRREGLLTIDGIKLLEEEPTSE